MRRTAALIAVVAAGSAVGLPAAGLAGKPKPVEVGDDFFAPTSVTVKSGDKLPFKWDGSNTNPHNVTLQKGPKKVKKSDFKSATGSIGIKFAPKFEKAGKYDFNCTIHPDTMKLTVTVKR